MYQTELTGVTYVNPKEQSTWSKHAEMQTPDSKRWDRQVSTSRDLNSTTFQKRRYGSFPAGTYKTEMCRSWSSTGTCPHGENCRFAHGYGELRPRNFSHNKYKTLICKNFQRTGQCRFATRCRFIHDEQRIQVSPNTFYLISPTENLVRVEVIHDPAGITERQQTCTPINQLTAVYQSVLAARGLLTQVGVTTVATGDDDQALPVIPMNQGMPVCVANYGYVPVSSPSSRANPYSETLNTHEDSSTSFQVASNNTSTSVTPCPSPTPSGSTAPLDASPASSERMSPTSSNANSAYTTPHSTPSKSTTSSPVYQVVAPDDNGGLGGQTVTTLAAPMTTPQLTIDTQSVSPYMTPMTLPLSPSAYGAASVSPMVQPVTPVGSYGVPQPVWTSAPGSTTPIISYTSSPYSTAFASMPSSYVTMHSTEYTPSQWGQTGMVYHHQPGPSSPQIAYSNPAGAVATHHLYGLNDR